MTQAIVAPTPAMQAGAEQLLAEPARWTHARRKAGGREFWIVRGRTGTYYTRPDGCTCKGYCRRGVCSHQVAATMKEARAAAEQAPAFACVARDCAEPVEERGGLCPGCADRKRRLLAELFGEGAR